MMKVEEMDASKIKVSHLFAPTTWEHRPNLNTAIRPEELNRLSEKVLVKCQYDPVERRCECIFADGTRKFVDIESLVLGNDSITHAPEKIKPKYTNCKNCGAPLKSDKCEYCGTFY